jgi:hypothetical protein
MKAPHLIRQVRGLLRLGGRMKKSLDSIKYKGFTLALSARGARYAIDVTDPEGIPYVTVHALTFAKVERHLGYLKQDLDHLVELRQLRRG